MKFAEILVGKREFHEADHIYRPSIVDEWHLQVGLDDELLDYLHRTVLSFDYTSLQAMSLRPNI